MLWCFCSEIDLLWEPPPPAGVALSLCSSEDHVARTHRPSLFQHCYIPPLSSPPHCVWDKGGKLDFYLSAVERLKMFNRDHPHSSFQVGGKCFTWQSERQRCAGCSHLQVVHSRSGLLRQKQRIRQWLQLINILEEQALALKRQTAVTENDLWGKYLWAWGTEQKIILKRTQGLQKHITLLKG